MVNQTVGKSASASAVLTVDGSHTSLLRLASSISRFDDWCGVFEMRLRQCEDLRLRFGRLSIDTEVVPWYTIVGVGEM